MNELIYALKFFTGFDAGSLLSTASYADLYVYPSWLKEFEESSAIRSSHALPGHGTVYKRFVTMLCLDR